MHLLSSMKNLMTISLVVFTFHSLSNAGMLDIPDMELPHLLNIEPNGSVIQASQTLVSGGIYGQGVGWFETKGGVIDSVGFNLISATQSAPLVLSINNIDGITGFPNNAKTENRVIGSTVTLMSPLQGWNTAYGFNASVSSNVGYAFMIKISSDQVGFMTMASYSPTVTRGFYGNSCYQIRITTPATFTKNIQVNPVLYMQYNDSSVVKLNGSYPFDHWQTDVSSTVSATSGQATALRFKLKFNARLSGISGTFNQAGASSMTFVLWDDNGAIISSTSIIQNRHSADDGARPTFNSMNGVILQKNTWYRIGGQPQIGNAAVYQPHFADSKYINGLVGWNSDFMLSFRSNSNTWANYSNYVPLIRLVIDQIEAGNSIYDSTIYDSTIR